MSELRDRLREEFEDKETRHIYAEDFLNTFIATQLKVLREDREWTQGKVAEEAGMRQERISVLEDVNYDSWSVKTLKRLAKAFDLRLSIKFESFGTFLNDFESFNRDALRQPSFNNDPVFQERETKARAAGGVEIPEQALHSLTQLKEWDVSQREQLQQQAASLKGVPNYGIIGRKNR